MLQISSMGSSLRGLGDARTDAITLQLAANRYAKLVGKTPLVTDGAIGSLTLAMVRAALQFLVTKNVSAATAAGLAAKLTTVAALTSSAVGVSIFLNDSMDTIKLAATPTLEPVSLIPIRVAYPMQTIPSPSAQTQPPQQVIQPPQQVIQPQQQQQQWQEPSPVAAGVGLSPTVKKYAMIGGGVLVGLYLLKKIL